MLCDKSNTANFWCIVEKGRIYRTIELNPTQAVEDKQNVYFKFTQKPCWQKNQLMNIKSRIDFLKYFSKKLVKPKKNLNDFQNLEKEKLIDNPSSKIGEWYFLQTHSIINREDH